MSFLDNIRAFIFDLDGLLVDSEPVYRKVWQTACRECGYEMSDEEHLELLGRGRRGALEHVRARAGDDFPLERLEKLLPQVEAKLFNSVELKLKPGAREILDELDSRQIKRIIATSTNREAATIRIKRTGLDQYFAHMVCGSDVARNKPAPDIFLRAVELLQEKVQQCLVLEDSESGLQAAHAAMIPVICIPDLKVPRPEVLALAQGVCNSLSQFIEENF